MQHGRNSEDHDKYKLDIIEDSAQALGSKFKKNLWNFWHAGSFSLYPAKLLGSFGDRAL